MAIKGLVGKEGNTLGTPEQPWEKVYTKPIELTEEHLTNYTYKGKPVYERILNLKASSNTKLTDNSLGSLESLGIVDCEKVINLYGMVEWGNKGTRQIPSSRPATTSTIYFDILIINGILYEQHGSEAYNQAPLILTIQYTKTTD